ncbi:hypothetical protein IQ06DRAFT_295168 [Phaeosphaeriaceae sp. SRC1lsM3a]|nr:hypothetical protein IQ06DRAFT_295168 [Stagonospora sp. SRC1lsM3a]
MRPILASSLILASALAAPDVLVAPFEPAVTSSPQAIGAVDADVLFARQNGNACATNYYACAALNAPGLCCPRTAICSADANRAVACCPQGAVCTGALGVSVTTTASSVAGFVPAATTTGNFEQTGGAAGGAGGRSTVQNAFYPFPAIPTTYSNAAACSAAYTSCQSDAAACTTALANGNQGVTVNAPNGGGATITAIPSVGLQSAQSICASLSLQACSGLQVEACRSFGGEQGAATRLACGGGYWMGAGAAAMGIAGGLI